MARVHVPTTSGSLVRAHVLLALIAAATAAGCSTSDTGTAPSIVTVPVQGKILVAGAPAAGIITLEPMVDGGSTTQAMGEIKDDGSFEVTSAGGKPGAMPGKYRVKFEPKVPATKATKKGPRTEVVVEVVEGKPLDINIP